MKTWTQWIGVSEPNDNLSLPINKDQYEQIQLDAIKRGMTEAARVSENLIGEDEIEERTGAQRAAAAILTTRDNLKEIPK